MYMIVFTYLYLVFSTPSWLAQLSAVILEREREKEREREREHREKIYG